MTVKVPAASSAANLTSSPRKSAATALLVSGSTTRSNDDLIVVGVTLVPSLQVTPSSIVKTICLGVASHLVARPAWTTPLLTVTTRS